VKRGVRLSLRPDHEQTLFRITLRELNTKMITIASASFRVANVYIFVTYVVRYNDFLVRWESVKHAVLFNFYSEFHLLIFARYCTTILNDDLGGHSHNTCAVFAVGLRATAIYLYTLSRILILGKYAFGDKKRWSSE